MNGQSSRREVIILDRKHAKHAEGSAEEGEFFRQGEANGAVPLLAQSGAGKGLGRAADGVDTIDKVDERSIGRNFPGVAGGGALIRKCVSSLARRWFNADA